MNKNIIEYSEYFKEQLHKNLRPMDEMTLSRRNIQFSNYTSGVVNNLIGGNFFTGLLILLNADDSLMGLITMAALLGNLLQVLSPLFLERFNSRKKLLIISRGIIYFFNILIIGIVPYIPINNKIKLMLILSFILAVNLMNAITAPGFFVWHLKSIPEKVRVKYFSTFNIINGVIIYSVILIFSKVVDYFKANGNELGAITILRVVALLLCFLDIYFLLKIKEYPNEKSETTINLVNILINPFKEKKYLITVIVACLWNFSVNIPGPYYTIYMLKDLKVSYSFLNIVNMVNIPMLILLTPIWSKRIKATSVFKTLYFLMGLFLIFYIGLAFVTNKTLFLYPISMIYSFILLSGLTLVFANVPFMNIPEKDQTNYIGFYSAMNSLAALFGILIGKEFIKHTEGITIKLVGINMKNNQYLLLLTCGIMLISTLVIFLLQKKVEEECLK